MVDAEKPKHPGGRPTKYTPELLEKAHEYVEKWEELGDVTPQLVGLSLHIGITSETLFEWERHENKAEFSYIVKQIRQMQHKNLVSKGLDGTHNPMIAKLLLSKHGYADKQELTGNNGGALQLSITRTIIDPATKEE